MRIGLLQAAKALREAQKEYIDDGGELEEKVALAAKDLDYAIEREEKAHDRREWDNYLAERGYL